MALCRGVSMKIFVVLFGCYAVVASPLDASQLSGVKRKYSAALGCVSNAPASGRPRTESLSTITSSPRLMGSDTSPALSVGPAELRIGAISPYVLAGEDVVEDGEYDGVEKPANSFAHPAFPGITFELPKARLFETALVSPADRDHFLATLMNYMCTELVFVSDDDVTDGKRLSIINYVVEAINGQAPYALAADYCARIYNTLLVRQCGSEFATLRMIFGDGDGRQYHCNFNTMMRALVLRLLDKSGMLIQSNIIPESVKRTALMSDSTKRGIIYKLSAEERQREFMERAVPAWVSLSSGKKVHLVA